MKKYKVGIIGATGMVGQRFALLLENHPWFEPVCLAASANSAGKKYKDAVKKWLMPSPMPEKLKDIVVMDATADREKIAAAVDFCFCAVNMKKDEIRELEYAYAKAECPIVSNNSAHRFTDDVPMIFRKFTPTTWRLSPRRERASAQSADLSRSRATARCNRTSRSFTP